MPNDLSYIVYIKCSRTDNQATIDISTENKQPIQDDYYYFTLGVLNSPEVGANSRTLSLLQGITTISGEYIKTGRISSNDGSTYFDLDSGEFKGKFTFTNGESIEEAITSFKAANWDINTQPDRNFHVTPTHLVEKDFQYKILGKLESLDDIQTTNPEFFI